MITNEVRLRPSGVKGRLLRFVVVFALVAAGMVAGLPGAAARGEVSVDPYHMVLEPLSDSELLVREQLNLVNNGEAAVPAGKVVLNLPAGATKVGVTGDVTFNVQGDTVVSADNIPKGESTVALSYSVNGSGNEFNLSRPIAIAAGNVFIITPSQGLVVEGTNVSDEGLIEIQDQQYNLFEAGNVTEGTVLDLRAKVQNSGTGTVTREAPDFHNPGHIRLWYQSPFSGINAHLFMVIVIVIPLAGLGYYLWRRKNPEINRVEARDMEDEAFRRLVIKEKALLQRAKELELSYRAGKMDAENYRQTSEVYRKKLVQVKLQLRRFTE